MYYQRELIYVATEQNKTLKINSGHNLLFYDLMVSQDKYPHQR
jgi:hypothetical protein